ncbi:hypothetical protein [Zobellella sp. DQSA1]|uniref:hypothetical protein n=1 Tax=Zobellella sp. DQSA1 TaxID=3342386 RepID=UPI0035C1FA28
MFEDQIECLQAISDELAQVVPAPWEKIEIEAKNTGQSSINIKAVYFNENGKHSLIDFVMLPRYFYELARLVSTDGKGLYSVCNFTLNSSGKYDLDFQY